MVVYLFIFRLLSVGLWGVLCGVGVICFVFVVIWLLNVVSINLNVWYEGFVGCRYKYKEGGGGVICIIVRCF